MMPSKIMALGILASLDTQVVTVGFVGVAPDRARGFDTVGSLGSISDGTSNIYGGAAITKLAWEEGGGVGSTYILKITGATNSGWESLTIGSTQLLRTAATTFSAGTWTWNTTDIVSVQPFKPASSNVIAAFR